MFRSQGKGFQIKFENGYTISVQFGAGNYCEHYDAPYEHNSAWMHQSRDAEVAVVAPNGEFLRITPFGNVRGFTTPNEVAALIATVATNPHACVHPFTYDDSAHQ